MFFDVLKKDEKLQDWQFEQADNAVNLNYAALFPKQQFRMPICQF
jgi:hypothetical protein